MLNSTYRGWKVNAELIGIDDPGRMLVVIRQRPHLVETEELELRHELIEVLNQAIDEGVWLEVYRTGTEGYCLVLTKDGELPRVIRFVAVKPTKYILPPLFTWTPMDTNPVMGKLTEVRVSFGMDYTWRARPKFDAYTHLAMDCTADYVIVDGKPIDLQTFRNAVAAASEDGPGLELESIDSKGKYYVKLDVLSSNG